VIPFWRYVKSYGHISTQVQGNVYMEVISIRIYISAYVYPGVLHYETVCHT